jgi:hypothetical protein
VSLVAAVLLAIAPAPIVEGRVGEPSGAGAAWAQVTLAQGERTQVVRTGADGRFRFRAFEGDGTLTVRLPQGWTAAGPLSRLVGPAFRGDVLQSDFPASPRRVVRGRLLVEGMPLPHVQVRAAQASADTDGQGVFVLDGLPAGIVEVSVLAPPLSGKLEVPRGPADLSRDVGLSVPAFSSLRLERLPQETLSRPAADWLEAKPLNRTEVARLDRLAALVVLDPAFRLAMVSPRRNVSRGARAAAVLQRYLTGPALVPRDRVVFAVAEFARPGRLELILTRFRESR